MLAVVATFLFAAFDAFSIILFAPFLSTLLRADRPEGGGGAGGVAPALDGTAAADANPLDSLLDATLGRLIDVNGDPLDAIRVIILLILGMFALKNIFDFLKAYLMAWVQQGVTRDLRDEVYDHLLELDMAFFGKMKMGQILSRLTYDVEQLRVLVAKELGKVVSQVFEFIAAAAVMILISAKLTLVAVVVVPITMGIWGPLIRKLKKNDRRVSNSFADVNTHIQETLAGIRLAMELGSRVITICNVVGSTMTREADGVIYTHAGPEIGVASTKAFTSQLAALFLLTLYLAKVRGTVDTQQVKELGQALIGLAETIEAELPQMQKQIRELIERYYDSRDFLFVGRGLNFPIALEGALKLKEISYIHAEGYAAGELKHGPIALIDKDMPVLAMVPQDSVYQKTVSNVEEIKARQGRLLLIGTQGDMHLSTLSEDILYLPKVHEDLNPLLYTIPAQLLAYEIANRRGCDVDQPRNLAKSVTVE